MVTRLQGRIRDAMSRRPDMTDAHVAAYLQIELWKWERIRDGEVRPTGDQIMLLCDLMDVEPSWFLRP